MPSTGCFRSQQGQLLSIATGTAETGQIYEEMMSSRHPIPLNTDNGVNVMMMRQFKLVCCQCVKKNAFHFLQMKKSSKWTRLIWTVLYRVQSVLLVGLPPSPRFGGCSSRCSHSSHRWGERPPTASESPRNGTDSWAREAMHCTVPAGFTCSRHTTQVGLVD